MLLRNESVIKYSIQIKLVFDNNTTRELCIHEGECVHVTYRKNGCAKCGLGLIRDIKPHIKKYCSRIMESATIVLDMSENNNAYVEKIELDDIIDIELAHPCGCVIPNVGLDKVPEISGSCGCVIPNTGKPEISGSCCQGNCCCNKKEEEPPKSQCNCNNNCECSDVQYSCLVGSVVTNEGVVAHG